MPRNHKTRVAYEVRVGNIWSRISGRTELTITGYLRVSDLSGLVTYYPPREFRIVPVAQAKNHEA